MSTDVENIAEIRERLTTLLPLLTVDNASLLESRHYKQLNMYLQHIAWDYTTIRNPERDYLLAVLNAYCCVGDPRAIRHVERIAQGRANTRMRDDEVKNVAARCLDYLTVVAAQLSHHNTLLRSAHVTFPSGELVRPAPSAPNADPAQLMRPSSALPED
jgi:hypothetical protein